MSSASTSSPLLPYRPCVGAMIVNARGNVWVGRRADMPGSAEGQGQWWQMPQGGIDDGEDPVSAVTREVFEETGIRSVRLIGQTHGWLTYDLPAELVGVVWGGKFRGQRQKWFALRFSGEVDEIDIAPTGKHPAEFEAWKWTPVEELVASIVPFKREVYRAVVAELGHLARPIGA